MQYVFRGKKIIQDSVAKFIELKDKFNSLLTINAIKSTAHPDFACKIKENKEVIYGREDPDNFTRQEITDYFSFHGMVNISKSENFLKNKSLFNTPTYGFEINNIKQQWDINEICDLEIARFIADNDPNILFL
jgi:CMP-N-acetylneuraminic acid synthetase